MQVKATDRMTGSSRTRGRGRVSGDERTFQIDSDSSAPETAKMSAPAATGGLDMLLSLQSVEPFGDHNRQAVDDSHRLLDLLDELKIGLLAGHVSGARLAQLERAVSRYELPNADPELGEILKAIDLRARVELAKLGRESG